jgi:hypothetical protein
MVIDMRRRRYPPRVSDRSVYSVVTGDGLFHPRSTGHADELWLTHTPRGRLMLNQYDC